MLSMYEQITIKTLANQNKKQTEIATEMGCHRNTVRNIINRPDVVNKSTRNKPSYFDQHHDQIKDLLDKKVSHLRIYEVLGETSEIERSYDSLSKYIRRVFPKIPEAYGVQVSPPGEIAEVDFGYAGLLPINTPIEPLRLAKTWFLSVRLNYSRHAYREMCHDQKVTTFIKLIEKSFNFFGGVPKRLKIDNLRAAVVKNQHYDLQFNSDFLDFATYSNTVINPCTPYHPEQKGGVESDMKYIENNFLAERHFTDFPDLEYKFREWSNNYANMRIHGITKKIPAEVFAAEEQPTLLPLPEAPYATYERCERKVQINCHVFFQNHYYSVPAKYVTQTVTLRSSGSLLKVIAHGEEVACHPISCEIGGYTSTRSHLPEYKCYGTTEYQKKYEAKMADIGEAAHDYFQNVLVTRDSYWYRSVRIILGLAHEYGNEAVNLSLARAQIYNVTDAATIKRIVTKRLYLMGIAPKLLSTKQADKVLQKENAIADSQPSTYLESILNSVRNYLLPPNIFTGEIPPGQQSLGQSQLITKPRNLDYYQQLIGSQS